MKRIRFSFAYGNLVNFYVLTAEERRNAHGTVSFLVAVRVLPEPPYEQNKFTAFFCLF